MLQATNTEVLRIPLATGTNRAHNFSDD